MYCWEIPSSPAVSWELPWELGTSQGDWKQVKTEVNTSWYWFSTEAQYNKDEPLIQEVPSHLEVISWDRSLGSSQQKVTADWELPWELPSWELPGTSLSGTSHQ